MGFKLNVNKYLILFSIVVMTLFSISLVSASAVDSDVLALADDAEIIDQQLVGFDVNETCSSSSLPCEDLTSSEEIDNIVVNQENFTMYFDDDNVLKKEYGGSVLVFDGKFENKGTITIGSSNTKITGRQALFNNTVFNLKANGVMLTNIHFVLDREFPENDNAGILIKSDNVTVYNCTIDYNVPSEKTGFAIFSNGEDWGNEVVNIIDNTINYVGTSYGNGFNYGLLLTETFNATISGNTINCSLPLRAVDQLSGRYGGSSMDYVAALVADTCRYLRLSNNRIYADVNGVKEGEPTLDALLIYNCHDAIIENNFIKETDVITQNGNVNYLYGLDLYLSKNVIVYGNIIDMFTTGGKEAHGAAYPIQITGPAHNVSIAFNNIRSFSYGPNVGIYSQNFYGETQLSIISNIINVTGYASEHSWALVAGIEAQDSNDIILNNTIDVRSVNEFMSGYNLYGISYSQQTRGAHSYNIQFNNVTTSGDWAVALMGAQSSPVINSIIANNILKARKHGGNRAALISGGFGTVFNNTDGSKHVKKSMTEDYYPEFFRNYLKASANRKIAIDFSWISRANDDASHNSKAHKSRFGNGPNEGRSKFNISRNGDGLNLIYTKSNFRKGIINSSYFIPGMSGVNLAGASASSGDGDSSESIAYEIDEKDNFVSKSSDYLQLGLICVVTLLLLLVGYKRQKDNEEEE